ncbi:DUF4190 domain-containing protein [Streptomyces sp. ISL-36]|uniref:DUF4190 domain-containing protein n=1 Tax=Streptomyces sp. ISL-36 TaxID=2819182 RepID=UPI001BE646BD|nr:DUF4190 domain-containing protein [Streptomyces sp. ISL-36]MBT2438858.1 DUF4190 domain-containing protein [Streptomyces sp. ISL-36]
MEPTPPPQDSQPPQQGWPAPGPGPYNPGPYAPYGPGAGLGPGLGPGPYGTPPRTTNGLAIASLVSGVVCCLPPLGLVFGLIALPQIRKKNQTGKGLAIAGIVLSSISCLLLVVGLVTGGFGEAWKSFRKGMDEASRSSSAFSLRTGDCYDVDGELEAVTSDVEVVDCVKPHEGEVTGTFLITLYDKWPGEDRIDDIAEDRCEEIGNAYALDTWAIPDDVWTYYFLPTSQSWRAGDRTVTCSYVVDGGEPIKGSLRSDGSKLGADQVRFLKAVNPIEIAVTAEPEEDVDADPAANKAWATEVHASVEQAGKDLRAHHWTGASAAPVAELLKELDAAAKEWKALAQAADADAYWEHYDTAFEVLRADLGADVREALGLTAQRSGSSDGGPAEGGPSGDGTSV